MAATEDLQLANLCDSIAREPNNWSDLLKRAHGYLPEGDYTNWLLVVESLFEAHGDLAKVSLKLAALGGFASKALLVRVDFNDLLDAYQSLSTRTKEGNPVLEGQMHAYCNWAMGITGEVGEVLSLLEDEANGTTFDAVTDEYGDILWYFAAMCTDLGKPLTDVYDKTKPLFSMAPDLATFTFRSCNHWKKLFCHGHRIDEVQEVLRMRTLHVMLYSEVFDVFGSDEEVLVRYSMVANLAKLDKRYKEKFTTEESVNRCN